MRSICCTQNERAGRQPCFFITITNHLQTLDNHVIYNKGNQYVTRFHANKKGGVLPSFFCAIYHI